MPEAEELSSLIETIYDSVVDASLWPVALRGVSRFVGGAAAGLYVKDAASRSGMMYHHDGEMPAEAISRYFEYYVRFDPATIRQYFMSVGDISSTEDLFPYQEFQETRFYREWAVPNGLVDHLAAIVDKDQTKVSLIGVFRRSEHGLVDAAMRESMLLVVPHIRRAVMIGGLLEQRASAVGAFSQALDSVRAAVFLVDGSGTIEHANLAGLKMLSEGDPVRELNGRLAGVETELQAALAAELGAPSFNPITAKDGTRHLVHILPLQSRLRDAGRATAAVFVQPAELPVPTAPEVIARAYSLTPSELRTLLAAVDTNSVAELAQALGVSETTVKFHLRGIYAKTGSHRQADLVKLVARFSGP